MVRDLPQNGAEHCHCSRVARRGNLSIASSLALIHDTPDAHQSLRLSRLLLRDPIGVEFTCKKFLVLRKQKDIASKCKRLINALDFTEKKLEIVLINLFIDINVILHEILFAKMEFYHRPIHYFSESAEDYFSVPFILCISDSVVIKSGYFAIIRSLSLLFNK